MEIRPATALRSFSQYLLGIRGVPADESQLPFPRPLQNAPTQEVFAAWLLWEGPSVPWLGPLQGLLPDWDPWHGKDYLPAVHLCPTGGQPSVTKQVQGGWGSLVGLPRVQV